MHRIHLLPVAALTLASALAHAQSSVTLYGIVDAYVGTVKNTGGTAAQGRTTVVNNGGMQTSFIGFRGSEDLGGGLSANFNLETFVRLDSGLVGRNDTDAFWGRVASVGLESKQWGRVSLGRHVSPYSLATTTYYSPFAGSTGFGTAFAHTFRGNIQGDTRLNNSIRYVTPNFGNGLIVDAVWSFGQEIDQGPTKGRDRSLDAVVRYVGDNWSVAAGTRQIDLNNANSGREQGANMVGGYYDFREAKVFAQAHRTKEEGGPVAAVVRRTYELGLSVPVGVGAVWATVARSSIDDNLATTSDQRRSWAVAYDYPMSKRTDLYVAAYSDRQRNPRIDQSIVAVGMRHRF